MRLGFNLLSIRYCLYLSMLILSMCVLLLTSRTVASADDLNPVWTGDLDGMVERRFIRALVPFNQTHFFIDKGRLHGATYEMLMKFEETLNKTLQRKKLRVKLTFIPVFRDEIIPALLEGRGDIAAAGLTITAARGEVVDFTDPLAKGIDEIVVAAPGLAPLTGSDDLAGKTVAVRESSSYYEHLQLLNAGFARQGKPPVTIQAISEHLEDEEVLEMVNAGLIPMTVVDNYLADLWSNLFTELRPYPDIRVNAGGSIVWMIRKESPQLKQALNGFIKKHKQGTLFGNIIIDRYLKDTQWIRNAMADEDVQRFKTAVGLFQKYGDKYDVDWLLVAACAYQESGIDQNKRSPAGAVGVMQMLPSTAAADPVNIPDIEQIEPNIHAGVKYLRWIHDTYFKDVRMDRANQARFTFAAYNAGPSRIQRLRREAAKTGYDPDTWFNQVEIVAAKRIGRETVQYVRNIHKYYTAYRLLMEKQAVKRTAAGEGRTD